MPTKRKKTQRVQLKNEIPTIVLHDCVHTYTIYTMVNSTAYTGYHEQKYKK